MQALNQGGGGSLLEPVHAASLGALGACLQCLVIRSSSRAPGVRQGEAGGAPPQRAQQGEDDPIMSIMTTRTTTTTTTRFIVMTWTVRLSPAPHRASGKQATNPRLSSADLLVRPLRDQ